VRLGSEAEGCTSQRLSKCWLISRMRERQTRQGTEERVAMPRSSVGSGEPQPGRHRRGQPQGCGCTGDRRRRKLRDGSAGNERGTHG